MNFRESYHRSLLALLVLIITVAFLAMMRKFVVPLVFAGIFSALLYPLYARILRVARGRRTVAAAVTLVLVVLVVLLPFATFVGILVTEAVGVSNAAIPWIHSNLSNEDQLVGLIHKLPMGDRLLPYRDEILKRAAEAVKAVGSFVVGTLSAVTRGTIGFLFDTVLMLYAMFFFLVGGGAMLRAVTRHLPLSDAETERLVGRFVSVARATLTSTAVIGVVQGLMGGIGLAIAGIPGAVFWGTLMTVLSMVPGIGTALVWVPACGYLFVIGRPVAAVLLALYCALVVGSVDNMLRPRLVGKGTQMPDLLVLLSTLGGIMMFGAAGFVLGPIIAALFITMWDIQETSVRSPSAPVGE